jgi:hypothetical protein
VDEYLGEDEELLLEARPHGVALVRPLARSLVLAGAGGAVLLLGSSEHWLLGALGAGAIVLAALTAAVAVWRWDSTRIVVTDDQLLVVSGVIGHQAEAVQLGELRVGVEQGLAGRMLGYGTLVAGDLEVPYVADPVRACRLAR